MDSERLEERVSDYLKALAQLEKAGSQPKDEFLRDSVIQRFEFTHELAWKMLKLRLEQEDVFARTPRETLQSSLEAGFIEDGNAWSDLQKMRNLTSHTYNEELAEEVYSFVVTQGMVLFRQLAQKAVSWQTTI
ncbi:nucleotidyltransferase substrate binding protein [Geomonas oryzisoli]|uniref:Nucleotidyltransferase substrate binding protein n=1 Tax=Geomonas oryzisoli TaxID=2847992 RepID=A0ABX8JD42_9BACT|nr:HI0074 family nucleotidyltransferase substrate-binding subunit [Geomonas oryzisoli]QWV94996.1 nucleotidyltransferase substrate binding protein [Geomonas oryzisoli]